MIGAWMERWLANRRFREIFGVLMAAFAVSIQFLNFQRCPVARSSVTHSWLLQSSSADPARICIGCRRDSPPMPFFARRASFRALAPFACLAGHHRTVRSSSSPSACVSSFMANILAKAQLRQRSGKLRVAREDAGSLPPAAMAAPAQMARPAFSPVVAACLRKEWLTLSRQHRAIYRIDHAADFHRDSEPRRLSRCIRASFFPAPLLM